MCREIQMGVASAALALENSGLDLKQVNHERMGVEFGANLMFSPPEVLKDACWRCVDEQDGERRFIYDDWGSGGRNAERNSGMGGMEPLWLLRYLPNMPACHIGIYADARGPSNSITLDDASGNLAVGEACRVIQRGQADVMIAGTTGTRLHPVKTMHAALWDDLAVSEGPPSTWSRPFDLRRSGQVVAEGACTFILESEEHARSRGAEILGTVLGAASSCVMDRNGRPDLRRALANAMRGALREAGRSPEDVGHINANGLGSRRADAEEALAIQDVFGERGRTVPVTAIKSYFGNAGSGSGTLELAASLLALKHGVILPTLNYETPDPECPLNVVHGEPMPATNKVVLKVSVTRMGQASAVLIAAT
jgi:3-oxoacyl-[acyl-carrier-protein] synthase II